MEKKEITVIKEQICNEREFDKEFFFKIVLKKTTAVLINNTNSLFKGFDILW